jgi:hypothetical protein
MVFGCLLLLAAACTRRPEPPSEREDAVAQSDTKPAETKPPVKIKPAAPAALQTVTLHVEHMTERLKLI